MATPTPTEKTLERLKHPDVNEPEPRDQRDQRRKKGVRIRRSSDLKTRVPASPSAAVLFSSVTVVTLNAQQQKRDSCVL